MASVTNSAQIFEEINLVFGEASVSLNEKVNFIALGGLPLILEY